MLMTPPMPQVPHVLETTPTELNEIRASRDHRARDIRERVATSAWQRDVYVPVGAEKQDPAQIIEARSHEPGLSLCAASGDMEQLRVVLPGCDLSARDACFAQRRDTRELPFVLLLRTTAGRNEDDIVGPLCFKKIGEYCSPNPHSRSQIAPGSFRDGLPRDQRLGLDVSPNEPAGRTESQ